VRYGLTMLVCSPRHWLLSHCSALKTATVMDKKIACFSLFISQIWFWPGFLVCLFSLDIGPCNLKSAFWPFLHFLRFLSKIL
jgi:hypothetical protein